MLRDSGVAEVAPALPTWQAVSLPDATRPLAVQVAEVEQRAIAAAMQATGNNKLAAARMLAFHAPSCMNV